MAFKTVYTVIYRFKNLKMFIHIYSKLTDITDSLQQLLNKNVVFLLLFWRSIIEISSNLILLGILYYLSKYN